MRLPLRFLPLAVLGMTLLASCQSTTFEVPKIGSRFEDTKKLLEYDTSLNAYVIPLEKYKTLNYEHFDITIPEDDIVDADIVEPGGNAGPAENGPGKESAEATKNPE